MNPLITRLALEWGLPDPGPAAARLAGLRPDVVAALAAELQHLAVAVGDASTSLDTAAGSVRRAWSQDRPAAAVAAVATAAAGCSDRIAGLAGAAAAAAAGLASAARSGAAAASTAELAAAGWPAVPAALPDAERYEVITTLCGALMAAEFAAERAAGDLIGALAADPTEPAAALVRPTTSMAGAGAGPSAPPAATRVDHDLRARAQRDLTSPEPQIAAFAAAVLASLARADRHGSAGLLVYEPGTFAGQGRAAIAAGDLASADHVAVLVPGIGNSPFAMDGTLAAAEELRGAADDQDPGAHTAVVTWFGYDIPGSAAHEPGYFRTDLAALRDQYAIGDADNAVAGAPLLAEDLTRFAAMAPAGAQMTLIGHSMGSVVASEAAALREVPVDSLVLVGSPGAGPDVGTAADYPSIDAEHVFVVADDRDLITRDTVDIAAAGARWATLVAGAPPGIDPGGASFGPDPASADFGAQLVAAGSQPPRDPFTLPSTGAMLGTDTHALSGYFAGPALLATAAVVAGRFSHVPTRPGRGARPGR